MDTYHTGLEIWWFPVKDICWFDAILDDSYCAVEEAHKMTASRVSIPIINRHTQSIAPRRFTGVVG